MTEIINPSIFNIGKQFTDNSTDNITVLNYDSLQFFPEFKQNCKKHIDYINMEDDGNKIEQFLSNSSNINYI